MVHIQYGFHQHFSRRRCFYCNIPKIPYFMDTKKIVDRMTEQPWLDSIGDVLQPAVKAAYAAGGETGIKVKNFMHGAWLGHPLHPVLTDIPIGAYTVAAAMDALEILGEKRCTPAADGAIAVGFVGAVGAAITGLTDWTGTTKKKRRIGLMHGLLNTGATLCYAGSLAMRRRKESRGASIALAMLGYGLTVTASYLGGHLVFREQVGVDHTATADPYPEKYVDVLPEDELKNNEMKCVHADNIPVLLVKQHNRIRAIALRCPWHQSVFSLDDGSVIEGPASEPQPSFSVRIRKGMIQVRSEKA